MAIRAVLLDIDGTLVLSNDAHAQAWVEAFRAHGYDVPYERVRPLIGMGGDKLLPTVVPGLNDEEQPGKDISQQRRQIFLNKYASSLAPAPGARALVERMQRDGLRVVVASSAKSDELAALLRIAQVENLIRMTTTSSEADDSKPAPDIVQVALQKAEVPPEEALLVGDTPYDIESASRSGIGVIAVRCGGFTDEQLAGAIAIYDDPADLLSKYDHSPLGASLRSAGAH